MIGANPMTAIKATGICKSFGKKQALTKLNLEVSEPGIIGLVGRNGAGKTTLLKLCAGLSAPTSGKLDIWGASPLNNLKVLSELIYSYHDVSYSSGLKLQTIIGDYALLYPNFDTDFARGLLTHFDLDPKARYAGLSQGSKSVFNFICALATRAPLTMLDEPTLGMDVAVRKAAYDILIEEYAQHPRTVIISSHLMAELENILDDLIIIDKGTLVLHDSIENVRQSAYRLSGSDAVLKDFTKGKKALQFTGGETRSSAIIYEPVAEPEAKAAAALGLELSAVRPEDLYLYLTQESKGGDLPCLW